MNGGMSVQADTEKPDEGRPRILFVDDDVAVCKHIADVLSDEFWVETADNGVEALRLLLRMRPDVVATDVVMPELDGIEFLKTLRATPSLRLIPVLLISGHAPESLRIEGFEQGADGYLAKPYTERELRARLRTMVQTARDRAAASRREAREQAEREATVERAALLESITDPIYALDRTFRITNINQRAADYFQRPREQLLGYSLWDLYPQVRGSRFETEYRRALLQHRSCEFEALSPFSGRWVDVHVYPTPNGLAVNFRDITERKEVERQLRDSELARSHGEIREREAAQRDAVRVSLSDSLRPLNDPQQIEAAATRILGEHLRAMRVSYVKISEDGTYATSRAQYVASGFAAAPSNYRLDDFGAAAIQDVHNGKALAVADVTQDPRLDAAARASTLASGVQAHVLAPVMYSRRLIAAVAVHDCNPRNWSGEEVAFIQEIAERICAALERVRIEAELREANRRKDEFLATLAHELRNPLAPLSCAAHLMSRSDLDMAQTERLRKIIQRQIHHMVRLVDDLLDVSRINVGQINLRNEVIRLDALIADAVEAARSAIDEGEHALEIQMPAEPVLVEGDGTRLVQVFQNLLNNAAKYTPRGGRIQVHAERQGPHAVIRVLDNGMGIAADAQERIFELFTRVHPQDAIKVSGLGIGLSLARKLVELHSGRVDVRSDGVNCGSEFTVTLPVMELPTPSGSSAPLEKKGPRARCRILVVDDNKDAAEAVALLLATEGFETRTADDGVQALAAISREVPDVVLLDIGMPGMDGYEVARRIRASEAGKNTVLCALTGWGQVDDKEKALQAGFDEHITKPVDPTALANILDAALQRRKATTGVHRSG